MRKARFIIFLLCILMCLSVFPVSARAETEGPYTYHIVEGEAMLVGYDSSYGAVVEIPSVLGGYPVASISMRAFCNRTDITKVVIPDSVRYIDPRAFFNCTGLTSVTFPDNGIVIDAEAFAGCTGLTSVVIPGSAVLKDGYQFKDCSALKKVTIGEGATQIARGVFMSCSSLESVSLPDSLTSVGICTFYWCTSLKNITIPNKVAVLDVGAFGECTSLTTITIPTSLTTVKNDAFNGCTNLHTVRYRGQEEQRANISVDYANESFANANWLYGVVDPVETPKTNTAWWIVAVGAVIVAALGITVLVLMKKRTGSKENGSH